MIKSDLVKELQNLEYLEWSRTRHSSGTAGTFLKAYSVRDGKKTYYKLSSYDPINGIVGHECVNEIIVDRLLNILGIEHLSYQLIHANILLGSKKMETWLTASIDFKEKGDSKIPFEDYYELERFEHESVFEFCRRMGWLSHVYEMLVLDYLILNRDRHGANVEVLRNRQRGEFRLAPLFDHGLSLLCSCRSLRDIEKFDVMGDRPVQSFFGGTSAWDNLLQIPRDCFPRLRTLEERDKELILKGLDDVMTLEMQQAVWDMIWGRWCRYEDLRNQK